MVVDIPVDYSFENYQSCQQRDLTFLSSMAFRNFTKIYENFQKIYEILTTIRADILVAIRATKNLENTLLPVNYWV